MVQELVKPCNPPQQTHLSTEDYNRLQRILNAPSYREQLRRADEMRLFIRDLFVRAAASRQGVSRTFGEAMYERAQLLTVALRRVMSASARQEAIERRRYRQSKYPFAGVEWAEDGCEERAIGAYSDCGV